MKERVEYYDVLRGISIIAVISIHATGVLDNLYNISKISFHIAVIWRQIVGFAVPLFLAISGYFFSNKPILSKKQYFNFLNKQIPKVYLPMLIWSIPLLGYLLFFKNGNIFNSLILFFVGGFSVYYFIALIIQYYLLLPLLKRLANKRGLILSTLISFLAVNVLYFTKILGFVNIPLIIYAGPFPVWLMFFVLGLYLGRNRIKSSKMKLFIFVLIGLIISIAETYFIFKLTNSFQGLGIKIGAFIYSFSVILLLFSLDFQPKRKHRLWLSMAYIGRVSFGIYLIHIYILNYLIRNLAKGLDFSNYFLEQLFIISTTTIVCVCIITAVRTINKPLSERYLGF